ncbi:MAG: tRNA (guanosine(37)-N1)-methyltransferase TrmD, partial [Phycisphaerales bacterium]
MRIDLLTIFPEMFPPVLGAGVIGRAIDRGVAQTRVHDLRRFSFDPHGRVDDRPFGGGPGMVMSAQPIVDAVEEVESLDDRPATRIVTSPQGVPLTQDLAANLAARPRLLVVAGRYEGIDERAMDVLQPLEVSVGDVVVSGGEIPAMLLVDAVIRLLPGALGDETSAEEDSFSVRDEAGRPLLDCPHYTRPRRWRGRLVPKALLDGDHAAIDRWRGEQRLLRTRDRRP